MLNYNQPSSGFNANENITLLCDASAVTKNASLSWVVDGVIYNSTGVFDSLRGQLMVEQSTLSFNSCSISSTLTVLNTQSDSQGVYRCILQDNIFVLSKNVTLMFQLQTNDTTKGLFSLIYNN